MPSALLTSQIETIRLIDKRIDGIRLELFRRGARFNTLDAAGWQLAWDRNPDLLGRHEALFRFRGIAQDTRDAIIESDHRAAQRRERAAAKRALRAAA
jgi:hypothetical protein